MTHIVESELDALLNPAISRKIRAQAPQDVDCRLGLSEAQLQPPISLRLAKKNSGGSHLRARASHRDGAAVTALQSHLDMVAEKKSDVHFDFAADAYCSLRGGDYLTADIDTPGADHGIHLAAADSGTPGADHGIHLAADSGTPGSDNGIRDPAMIVSVTSKGVLHAKFEIHFTFNKEAGVTGVAEFCCDLLSGWWLPNLDAGMVGLEYVAAPGRLLASQVHEGQGWSPCSLQPDAR